MSETSQAPRTVPEQPAPQHDQTPRPPRYEPQAVSRPSGGWAGGIVFASTLLIVLGAFQVILGLTALFRSGYYVVTESGMVLNINYNVWGWLHFALGVLAVAAGLGLMKGQMWARAVGIALAVGSAIVNLAFIPAYPVWSIIVIALDVVIIYAIAVHGRDVVEG